MKKLLTLALALMMVLSLVACGGADTPSPEESADPGTAQEEPGDRTDPGASQQEPSDEPDDSVDVSSLSGFLGQFGLTEDDLKPAEHFSSFEYTLSEYDNYEGLVEVHMDWGDKEDDGEYKELAISDLIRQIYDRTIAVSDDGKAYEPYTTEEVTLDTGFILDAQWEWCFEETGYWLTIRNEFDYLTIYFN